jgi:hypothetical protein
LPYVTRWPHKRAIALAASCATLLITAAPAAAAPPGPGPAPAPSNQTTCAAVPASAPVLSVLGDQANYVLLAGGSFEGGTQGWSLNNASVVSGNEPWNVGGADDSNSLNIQPGGSATSPLVCGNNLFPTFRFFAKSAQGAPASALHVGVQYSILGGWSGYRDLGTLNSGDYTSWQPTPSLALGSLLPTGMTAQVRFVFTADNGAAWNIDDVYVDPYAR